MTTWLAVLVAPWVVAAVVAALPARVPGWAVGWVATLGAACVAVLGGLSALGFDREQAGLQQVVSLGWSIQPGHPSAIGVDGWSLPLVLLTLLVFPVAHAVEIGIERAANFHVALLVLESVVLAVFLAVDWALFYAAWELTLVPLFLLVGRWGGPDRGKTSLMFLQVTMAGSIWTLLALLWLTQGLGGALRMDRLAALTATLPPSTQALALVGVSMGFFVKLPVLPLHGWLRPTYTSVRPGVGLVLSGLLVKMAAYGLLRAFLALPAGAAEVAPVLGVAGALGAVHGALLAWRASDLRTMIACLSLSHMGVVLAALSTRSELGLTGALLQMVAHGVVSPLLFVLVGVVERAYGSSAMTDVGALARRRPALALAWTVALAASLGLPGLASFPGEVHGWVAVARQAPWLAPMLVAAMFLGAAASVRALDRLLWGPSPAGEDVRITAPGASASAAWLGGWAVLLGWWPTAVLAPATATLAALSGALGGAR